MLTNTSELSEPALLNEPPPIHWEHEHDDFGRIKLADAEAAMARWGNGENRVAALLWYSHKLSIPDWRRLVGSEWDSIEEYRGKLVRRMAVAIPVWKFTPPESLAARAALPNKLTLYRGCFEGWNINGVSFSLDRDTAISFTTMNRYRISDAKPILLVCEAKKSACAYFDGRGEREIVTFERRIIERIEL